MFRLAQLITKDTKQKLSFEIKEDIKKFLDEMKNEDIDMKALGLRGHNKEKMLELLYQCYGLSE